MYRLLDIIRFACGVKLAEPTYCFQIIQILDLVLLSEEIFTLLLEMSSHFSQKALRPCRVQCLQEHLEVVEAELFASIHFEVGAT